MDLDLWMEDLAIFGILVYQNELNECSKSVFVCDATKIVHIILDTTYKNVDLNKNIPK